MIGRTIHLSFLFLDYSFQQTDATNLSYATSAQRVHGHFETAMSDCPPNTTPFEVCEKTTLVPLIPRLGVYDILRKTPIHKRKLGAVRLSRMERYCRKQKRHFRK